MRYNGDGMSNVLKKLNESQTVPFVEPEPTIGVTPVEEVHQCVGCGGFYKGSPDACPICGGMLKVNESRRMRKRRLHESDEDIDIDAKLDEDKEEEVIDTVQDDEKLPKDVEVEINEGMRLLTKGNYKKFNESFKNTKLLKNGKINFLVESERTGRMYSVVRRATAIQKANYRLAESMSIKTSRRATTNAKLESVRAARTSLAALTEMNAVKVAAIRMLERQGVRFNYKAVNESLNRTIAESAKRFRKKFEAIDSDKETGAIDFTESTPEEIAQDVTEVVKDSGLEVVTQEVDATPDTAAVQIRVQDDPALEINLQDIADTASEVMDAPVAVVGPSKPEGDSTLADITVLVNPDEDAVDEGEKVALSESLRRRVRSRRLNECDDMKLKKDDTLTEDEDVEVKDEIEYPKLSERKSVRRKRRFNEGIGDEVGKAAGSFARSLLNEEDDEQKMIDAEYDNLDAEDDELRAEKKLSERRVRKIKEADEVVCDDHGDPKMVIKDDTDEDDDKIVITEEDSDSDETKDLIDQAKKLEEKIRRSRRMRR